AVEAEIALRRGETDEHRRVDLGGERGGVEDAGKVEPHASEPDALAGIETVDAEALRRGVAEHGHRLACRRRVEICPRCDRRADGSRQVETRRLNREGIRVDGGEERAAVDAGGRRARVLHLLDGTDAGDHPWRGERELRGLTE